MGAVTADQTDPGHEAEALDVADDGVPRRPRRRRPARVAAAVLGGVLLLGACAPAEGPATPGTESGGGAATPTVEERRLEQAIPRDILARSGFDDGATTLTRALGAAPTYEDSERTAVRQGQELWRRAVDRAQGRAPESGGLDRSDDRPLYWARLSMTAALRAWQPQRFALDDGRRARLVAALETSSRGQDTARYPDRAAEPSRRVLVTGFDPFTLDEDVRRSNPSGATALALDGTVAQTSAGPVRFEAAMFPVRWTDFADGTVERVVEPRLPEVDLFSTMSQGSPGRFDLERTNGAWRGTTPDNVSLSRPGLVPVADPASQPQWTTTTLPSPALAARGTGRFPVVDHTEVTEIPAGGQEPVERPDGPTPGSAARAGGGGTYLSNEIAYRATLVRDRLGLHDRLPGGHLHTPVLDFGPGNTDPATGTVTDETVVRNRVDIVAQSRAILLSAVEITAPAG